MGVTKEQLEALAAWDTPTICNGLEVVAPERRTTGFTTKPFAVLRPDMKPIVGVARTATIRAMEPVAGGKENRSNYYGYVADADLPVVIVMQDLDHVTGFGAFWGEVNTTIHKGLGALGCVTNGSFRDVEDSAPGFQLLGGMVAPSHGWVDVVDYGGQVNVHGMAAQHNDVIHADQHGAVVIPEDAVAKLPDAIDMLTRKEAVILEAARSDDFDIEALRAALATSVDIH